jgi:hypothetical protein
MEWFERIMRMCFVKDPKKRASAVELLYESLVIVIVILFIYFIYLFHLFYLFSLLVYFSCLFYLYVC